MEIECTCGFNCVEDAPTTLKHIKELYTHCNKCKDPKLRKFKPLKDQLNLKKLNANSGLCNCGKRHLDQVMAHTLKIMMEEGIRAEGSTLRNAGTPLLSPAYPITSAPYLPNKSLVILAEGMNKKCAERIINEIPEVKGVLKGDIKQTVGLKDSNSSPHVYKLLAGCDMRCDIVLTPYDTLCIYKNQAEIHVEFSKPISPKIEALKKIITKYNDLTVLDCTCGPGTLGIACLKSGAKKVVFNDLWYPATKMAILNLEVNGFKTNFFDVRKGLIGSGKNFEVYCENIMDLKDILTEKFDICIIDTFPGVDTADFVESVKEMCREVVII
ncbi:MAG: 50S ribosomal protein L11 methyltransferase [Methanobacterium sp.]|uniref:50S ribosomal protein L11 methyltransferase n=1 Tax=Methanobacterium sp. TaxID=2164 RepID=UPI003C726C3C